MDYMGVIQDTSRNPGTSFIAWCTEQGHAGKKAGINLRTSVDYLVSSLTKVGFVDCQVREFKLPIGPWPKSKRLRDARGHRGSEFALVHVLCGVEFR
jgi:hypothetical protein